MFCFAYGGDKVIEVAYEMAIDCPQELLDELEKHGFMVTEFTPFVQRYEEKGRQKKDSGLEKHYRCVYNNDKNKWPNGKLLLDKEDCPWLIDVKVHARTN